MAATSWQGEVKRWCKNAIFDPKGIHTHLPGTEKVCPLIVSTLSFWMRRGRLRTTSTQLDAMKNARQLGWGKTSTGASVGLTGGGGGGILGGLLGGPAGLVFGGLIGINCSPTRETFEKSRTMKIAIYVNNQDNWGDLQQVELGLSSKMGGSNPNSYYMELYVRGIDAVRKAKKTTSEYAIGYTIAHEAGWHIIAQHGDEHPILTGVVDAKIFSPPATTFSKGAAKEIVTGLQFALK